MRKCQEDKTHYLDGLREYNNTPLSGMDVSPAQIMMSRICRTVVPILTSHLEPKVVSARPMLEKIKAKVKERHDKRARRKPVQFMPGDKVVCQRGRKWHKCTVVRKHPAPRSYIVELENGRQLRRNTYHLRKSCTQSDRHDEQRHLVETDGLMNNAKCLQVPETAEAVGEPELQQPRAAIPDDPGIPEGLGNEGDDNGVREHQPRRQRRRRNWDLGQSQENPERPKRATKRPWWWDQYVMLIKQNQNK